MIMQAARLSVTPHNASQQARHAQRYTFSLSVQFPATLGITVEGAVVLQEL